MKRPNTGKFVSRLIYAHFGSWEYDNTKDLAKRLGFFSFTYEKKYF